MSSGMPSARPYFCISGGSFCPIPLRVNPSLANNASALNVFTWDENDGLVLFQESVKVCKELMNCLLHNAENFPFL